MKTGKHEKEKWHANLGRATRITTRSLKFVGEGCPRNTKNEPFVFAGFPLRRSIPITGLEARFGGSLSFLPLLLSSDDLVPLRERAFVTYGVYGKRQAKMNISCALR
jgi:hypothetical protein